MKSKVLVIQGITGTSKTKLASLLTDRFRFQNNKLVFQPTDLTIFPQAAPQIQLICADSVQLYQECDIVSDKYTLNQFQSTDYSNDGFKSIIDTDECPDPPKQLARPEKQSIQTKLVMDLMDMYTPTESTNTMYNFRMAALKAVRKAVAHNQLPVLVGGSTRHLEPLLSGRELAPISTSDAKLHVYDLLQKVNFDWSKGVSFLKIGSTASQICRGDYRRLCRYLEIEHMTNRPVTDFPVKEHALFTDYDVINLCLVTTAPCFLDLISERIEGIVQMGSLVETCHLYIKYAKSKPANPENVGVVADILLRVPALGACGYLDALCFIRKLEAIGFFALDIDALKHKFPTAQTQPESCIDASKWYKTVCSLFCRYLSEYKISMRKVAKGQSHAIHYYTRKGDYSSYADSLKRKDNTIYFIDRHHTSLESCLDIIQCLINEDHDPSMLLQRHAVSLCKTMLETGDPKSPTPKNHLFINEPLDENTEDQRIATHRALKNLFAAYHGISVTI